MTANLVARLLLHQKVPSSDISRAQTSPVNWHFYAEQLSKVNGTAGKVFRNAVKGDPHGEMITTEVAREIISLEPKALVSHALRYASLGWHVFPLRPKDKRPLTQHGYKEATCDSAQVIQWWSMTPAANIGLACEASGLAVVDIDGKEGSNAWEQLKVERDVTDSPLVSFTPGKPQKGPGRHLIYRGRIRSSTGKLAAAIDTRGEGGYIVLPPSVHPDHPSGPLYRWEDESQITIQPPELPSILANLVEQADAPIDPWRVFTLADAFRPRQPITWLVDGLIDAGSLIIVYGAPGTLKSMLLADLATSVAAGQPWLAHPTTEQGMKTTQSPVLWADFDNGQRRTHERFAALARARSLAESTPLFYVSMPEPHLDAGDTQSMHDLAARVLARNVRLVVIDNLGVVAGSADENSAEMQAPMAGLRWLAESTGAAVIVLHHQRKAGPYGQEKRVGETLRGHGSIEAKLDLALLVTRDNLTVTLIPTKMRGAAVSAVCARFAYDNDDSHELVTARFWPADVVDEKAKARSDVADRILIALAESDEPLSKRDLANKAHVKWDMLTAVISTLVTSGQVEMTNGKRNSQLYSLIKKNANE